MGRGKTPPSRVKPYAVAAAAGLAVICGILIITSWLASAFDMPEGIDIFFSYIALAGGCLASGRFCGKKLRHNGLINGCVCGLAIIGVMVFLSLFTGNFNGDVVIIKVTVAAVFGSVGGITGVNAQMRI